MFITRAFSKKKQLEICLACELPICTPESRGCGIRREVNRLQRERYWANLNKSRASRRKEAMPPEQYEKKKRNMRRYYRENKDVVLMKQKIRQERIKQQEGNSQ